MASQLLSSAPPTAQARAKPTRPRRIAEALRGILSKPAGHQAESLRCALRQIWPAPLERTFGRSVVRARATSAVLLVAAQQRTSLDVRVGPTTNILRT